MQKTFYLCQTSVVEIQIGAQFIFRSMQRTRHQNILKPYGLLTISVKSKFTSAQIRSSCGCKWCTQILDTIHCRILHERTDRSSSYQAWQAITTVLIGNLCPRKPPCARVSTGHCGCNICTKHYLISAAT